MIDEHNTASAVAILTHVLFTLLVFLIYYNSPAHEYDMFSVL